jgi:hypothetical protein
MRSRSVDRIYGMGDAMRLVVEKLPDGGYAVIEMATQHGCYSPYRFAATTLQEALEFIRKQFEPHPPISHPWSWS